MENEVNRYTIHFFWKKTPKNGTFSPFVFGALLGAIHKDPPDSSEPPGSTCGRLAQLGERGVCKSAIRSLINLLKSL